MKNVLLNLTALALMAAAPVAKAAEELKLLLGWTPGGNHAAIHYAKHYGLYAKEGLNVITEDGRGTGYVANVVGGGTQDVGEGNVATMAIAVAKGLSLRSIMLEMPGSDLGVIVPVASGARTIKDLETKGISLVYSPGAFEAPFLDILLKNGGSSRDKVQLISVDMNAKIGMYMSGKGGALISSFPFLMPMLRQQKPSNVIKFADYGLPLPSYGLFATDETIKRKGAALRTLVRVTSRAWEEILANPAAKTRSVEAMMAQRPQVKLDAASLEAQIDEYRPLFHSPHNAGKPIGWQAEADWAATVKVLQQAGLVEARFQAQDFYTNQFLE
jgi:NitT/TauT family transport system substrate-binding protein